MHLARAAERDEVDLALVAGLEADGGAGRDVEVHPERPRAIEAQRGVDLEEVEVRADLHRAVAGVRDGDGRRLASGAQLDLALGGHDLARLVPSSTGLRPGGSASAR